MIYTATLEKWLQIPRKDEPSEMLYKVFIRERADVDAQPQVTKHRSTMYLERAVGYILQYQDIYNFDVVEVFEDGEVSDMLSGDMALMAKLKWGVDV